MKRRIVALESASYRMALNAQIQTQAYPASYVPKPPPSVQNSRFFSRKSPSNNRKNRIVWKSKPSRKKSPRWEQGIIGRLLSKGEKSRCVLYGQRKHEINEKKPIVNETATKQKVHKAVSVNTLHEKKEVEASVDEENAYADNDFEDDDDDDKMHRSDENKYDAENIVDKRKNQNEQGNGNEDDVEDDGNDVYDNDFENEEEQGATDSNVNNVHEGEKAKQAHKLEPPRMFKARWFTGSKSATSSKQKKRNIASHPYTWNHWKTPEMLRVEKALENYGPTNPVSIRYIDKRFDSLVKKAKKFSGAKRGKFIRLKWSVVSEATTYIIEHQNRDNEWVEVYRGRKNSCVLDARKVHVFKDESQLCIMLRSKSSKAGGNTIDAVISPYSNPFVCYIQKQRISPRGRSAKPFPSVPEVVMNAPPSQFPIYNNKTSAVLPASPLKRAQDENSKFASSPFIPKKKRVLIVSGKGNESSLSVAEREPFEI